MSVYEQLKEHDYEYLLVKGTLEDIQDDYVRNLVLEHFDRLIKRLCK